MRFSSWLLSRLPKRQCVAGIDVGPTGAWVVVLTGELSGAETVCCCELLDPPEGLLQGAQLIDPFALGHWLKRWLNDKHLFPDGLCLAVDDAWLTRQVVSLSAQLSERDVAFQLAAELPLAEFADASPLCWAYTASAPEGKNPSAAVHAYALAWLAQEPVQRLIGLAKAVGIRAWVVEPRSDAAHRAEQLARQVSCPSEPVAKAAQTALGLALSAWAETGMNFLPHRRWARQRRQRAWLQRLGLTLGVGASLGGMATAGLAHWAQAHQALVVDQARMAERLTRARDTQQSLQALHKQWMAQRQWAQAQHSQQRQTLLWHAGLADAGVWVSQLRLHQSHWVVQGEALGADQVRQWAATLAQQPVWQNPPEVHQLQFKRSASTSGGWVWHFRLEADLKDAR